MLNCICDHHEKSNRQKEPQDKEIHHADETCIAYPEGKELQLNDEQVVSDLRQKKSGTMETIVDGNPVADCSIDTGAVRYL